jgi:GAF domain-containing protein
MNESLKSLLQGINDETAILANASAFIHEFIPDVNWVGFYIFKKDQLILGPFQGRPACVYIPMGRGACGRSAETKATVILNDVTKETNYIACHSETKSEIVIPLIINNHIYGVLDIDSLSFNRFDEDSKQTLEALAKIIINAIQSAKLV